MIVVDASVLAVALVDDDLAGDSARARLGGQVIAAPDLIRLEVMSVIRRQVAAKRLTLRRADLALGDLAETLMRVAPHAPLMPRIWELRQNVTVYDAAYVALAEALDVPLVTGDARLSRAAGPRCRIEVLHT